MNEVFIALSSVLLGFILGILGQVALSKIKESKDKKEFKKFEEMITKEYINPYHELSEDYFGEVNSVSNSDLRALMVTLTKRINHLKEEEIHFLKIDNQFKMIRLIEFTKGYFQQSVEILNTYSFQYPNATQEDYANEKETHRKKIEKLRTKYTNKKEKYLNLEVDSI